MRAVTVYRLDDSSNFSYHTRHPIGSVLEMRIYERVNNYKDLLRLARRLFALDTADGVHVLIDVGQGRQAYLPEPTRDCSGVDDPLSIRILRTAVDRDINFKENHNAIHHRR